MSISLPFLRRLVLVLLVATMSFCRLQPIYWEDVWWHLAAGRYILAHHSIPTVDIFSWTMKGAPWINTEWLYQVVLYGWFQALGLAGIALFKTLLALTAIYFVDRRLRLWGAGLFERFCVLGLVFLGGWPFWIERADLSSLAIVSALFLDLDRLAKRPEAGIPHRFLWIAIFAVWSNVHGLFPLGLVLIGLDGFCLLYPHPALGKKVLAWGGLCFLATLINPHGFGLYTGIYKTMSGRIDLVYEWLPPSGLGFLFFFLSLGISIAAPFLRRRLSWNAVFPVLSTLMFAVYACLHGRFVHFFMVGVFPYAAAHWLSSPWREKWARRLSGYERPVLAVAAVFLLWTSARSAHAIRGGIDAASSGYVKEACDFIQAERIAGPFYNEYKFGSYWIWRFQGNPPVFQDGRHKSVLGYIRVTQDGLQARQSPERWQDFLNRYGIEAALIRYPNLSGRAPSALDRYMPRRLWGLVYWDDLCLLYVRRSPQNASLLRRWEFRWSRPDWSPALVEDQLRRRALDRAGLAKELRANRILHPDSRRTRDYLDALGPAGAGN